MGGFVKPSHQKFWCEGKGNIFHITHSFPPIGRGFLGGVVNMFYVYILKSKKDNNFYMGSTNDLKRRINEHNSGLVFSTKSRMPFTPTPIGVKESVVL